MRLAVDAAVLTLAVAATLLGARAPYTGWEDRVAIVAFPVLVLALLHARDGSKARISGGVIDALAQLLGVVSLSAMLVIALDSILGGSHPVSVAVRLWVFSLFYLFVARISLRSIRAEMLRDRLLGTPTLIVGAGIMGERLARRMLENPAYGLRPVGLLDPDPLVQLDGALGDAVAHLDGADGLLAAVAQTGAQQVIVAFSSEQDADLVGALETCRRRGIEVAIVPRMYELVNERSTLDHVGGVPLVSLRPTNPHGWEFAVKHAIDTVFAAVALVLLSPFLAAIAIGVRVSSPGPVLFRQWRVGRDGREFELLKFRTMISPVTWTKFDLPSGLAPGGIEGADRRTRLGAILRATSLDELPQLINVVRGEMSIVGPRPERPEFVQVFAAEIDRYHSRHRVKAGMTGWAQVHGLRGQTSIDARVESDNFYIQNWSLKLDFKIIAMTLAELLRLRG